MHELKHNELIQRGSKFEAKFTCKFDNEMYKGKPAIETIVSQEYSICGLVLFQIKADVIKHYNENREITMCFIISFKFWKVHLSDLQTFTIQFSSNIFSHQDKVFVMDDTEWRQIFIERYNYNNNEQFKLDFDLSFNMDLVCSATNLFAPMREDTDFTDFQLCGENGSVKVHKAMMASHSPVLMTLFKGQWKETGTGTAQVPHTTVETLQHLKDYVYLQKLPDHGIKELLYLASYYMMTDLQQKCSVKLLRDISVESVTELLDIAMKYEIEYLYVAVLKIIQDSVIKVDKIAKYGPFKKQNTDNAIDDVME